MDSKEFTEEELTWLFDNGYFKEDESAMCEQNEIDLLEDL